MSAEPLFFQSTPVAPDKMQNKGAYSHALYALHHDAGVAENVFARVAKTDFARLLQDIDTCRCDLDEYPMRVAQETVVFDARALPSNHQDEELEKQALVLLGIVTRVADSVLNSYRGKTVHLIGALQVRVRPVGDRKFSFSVKQKWFCDG